MVIHEHHCILGSTNGRARELAKRGLPAFTCVSATMQSHGRGQHGRNWVSPPGGLYLSILMRPEIALEHVASLPLWVGLQLFRLLEPKLKNDQKLYIKWPNDLWVHDQKIDSYGKLAGVLIESSVEEQKIDFLIVGIGINLSAVTQLNPRLACASLYSNALIEAPKIEKLIYNICNTFQINEHELHEPKSQNKSDWIQEVSKQLLGLGSEVKLNFEDQSCVSGQLIGLDHRGAILIKEASGHTSTHVSGRLALEGLVKPS